MNPRLACLVIITIAVIMAGCKGEDAEQPQPASQSAPPPASLPDHTVVRAFEIEGFPGSVGRDILVDSTLTEDDLVKLVRGLARDAQVARIVVMTSREAFQEQWDGTVDNKVKTDWLVYYVKETSENIEEVRWEQQAGKFQDKYGTKTTAFAD